jgi:lipid-A-disaccharide synthase
MKIYWIAGEPSGDVQAAAVAEALQARQASIEQRGWGGPKLKAAGVALDRDICSEPFMGFVEVVLRARTITKRFSQCKRDVLAFQPDVLVLVDYPGFNLRMAAWAKSQGIRVAYFIPPKIWAWKEGRIEKLRQHCDAIYSILPFEKAWYKERGLDITYVGNPLAYKYKDQVATGADCVALLPGSRKQEIKRHLPVFYDFARLHPVIKFKVIRPAIAQKFWPSLAVPENVEVFTGPIEEGLHEAMFAATCSGTASLEVALLKVPQVVVYKANPVSLRIAKLFVKVKYFSLPNLILNRPAITELLQEEVIPKGLSRLYVESMRSGSAVPYYEELVAALDDYNPGDKTAEELIDLVSSQR